MHSPTGEHTNVHPTSAEGHAAHDDPRLELSQLEAVVQGYFGAGLAPSTHNTYTSLPHIYAHTNFMPDLELDLNITCQNPPLLPCRSCPS